MPNNNRQQLLTPSITVPHVPEPWNQNNDPFQWHWADAFTLPPLQRADGSGPALLQTTTRLCYNDQALFVRFDCTDNDIWGTYTERDEPIYDEEVVEVFIAPSMGIDDDAPHTYYELEVSPNGTLLDALAYNPTSDRAQMQIDFSWDCPGLQWGAKRDDARQQWSAYFAIPWRSLTTDSPSPRFWHANFYRIERPRRATPEFSCWSPTMTDPADFHKPDYFGMLILGE